MYLHQIYYGIHIIKSTELFINNITNTAEKKNACKNPTYKNTNKNIFSPYIVYCFFRQTFFIKNQFRPIIIHQFQQYNHIHKSVNKI